MKSTVVDESLSSFKTNVLFQRIPSFYKLLPVFKHGFLRSEENVYLAILYTQNVYQKMFSSKNIFLFLCRDKLLPVFKHGFLMSEESVYLAILYTQNVY